MTLGGFNGSDPWPSLSQFQKYVRDGKFHYLVDSGNGGGPGGKKGTSSAVTDWVHKHFPKKKAGKIMLYYLTKHK